MKLFIVALLATISYAQTGTMCDAPITGETTEDQHSRTYVFTADIPNYIFDTCSTDFDTMLQILDSNGNEVHFNDDHSGDCENGNNQYASHLETELQTGQQYKLKINGYCSTCFGPFTIDVSCPDPCAGTTCLAPAICDNGTPAPVHEDSCCGDASLCPDPCADVVCLTTTCGDGSTAPVPDGGCCGDAGLCPDTSLVTADDSGVCPSGYTSAISEQECREMAGSEVNGNVVGFSVTGCSGRWPPKGMCFEWGHNLYYVTRNCGQVPDYRISRVICRRNDCGNVVCPTAICSADGSQAPTPDGECCGDVKLCPDTSLVSADTSGVCPSGYTSTISEGECREMAGGEVNGNVVGFSVSGCSGRWPPKGTCFEWGHNLYYVNGNCGQVPDYRISRVICKRDGGAQIALDSQNEKAAAEFEVIGTTNNAVTIFAIIGAISLMYHGVKKVHKVVFGTNDFHKINDNEC